MLGLRGRGGRTPKRMRGRWERKVVCHDSCGTEGGGRNVGGPARGSASQVTERVKEVRRERRPNSGPRERRRQMRSSVATRWARRRQTRERRTKEAGSARARERRMCMRISSGRAASGQGGGGMPSMGGGAGGMERWEKEAMRSVMDWGAAGAASAERVGTVGVLVVVVVVGVGLGGGLGKCLALYF